MYGYEGIGSIYWHMVGKLLVAVQEAIIEARDVGAPPAAVHDLVDAYWRVRSGLGFNQTAAESERFPPIPTPTHRRTPVPSNRE
jgi:hypothetical protein